MSSLRSTALVATRFARPTPASHDGRAALTRFPLEGEVGADFCLLGRLWFWRSLYVHDTKWVKEDHQYLIFLVYEVQKEYVYMCILVELQ